MKKKKLKLMNIKEDQELSRYDLKSIMAGSYGGGCDNCAGCYRSELHPSGCIEFYCHDGLYCLDKDSTCCLTPA